MLMVAHDVNPILRYLDQVIYLAEGGAAAGPPREVITGETLSRLYGVADRGAAHGGRQAGRGRRRTRRPTSHAAG